jgi:hypothetical protein
LTINNIFCSAFSTFTICNCQRAFSHRRIAHD